jgi:hypothetical protein
MYQVGFGDCFLVTFEYRKKLDDGRKERHVLIDFGSTRKPEKSKVAMVDVAERIVADTGGHVDVVVATHRHKDHISGFGDATAGPVLDQLKPTLVVRPWTENPKAADKATGLLSKGAHRFALGLGQGQAFAEQLADALAAFRTGARAELRSLAELQLANRAAITRLDRWADKGDAAYVFAGEDSGIGAVVPGVDVSVLGPPTIDQWAEVATQRAADKEYWMLYEKFLAGGLVAATAAPVDGDEDAVDATARIEALTGPGPVRWLVEHMRNHEVHSLERLVRSLDAALNNTSIILLFEVGGRRLLFPGDAQIENWNYTLHKLDDALRDRLATIDLYKVGHHGSRNATPISLFKLWAANEHPLAALMSTRAGVHGKSEATKVPRSRLVRALEGRTTLFSTEKLGVDDVCIDVAVDVKGSGAFEPVPA